MSPLSSRLPLIGAKLGYDNLILRVLKQDLIVRNSAVIKIPSKLESLSVKYPDFNQFKLILILLDSFQRILNTLSFGHGPAA